MSQTKHDKRSSIHASVDMAPVVAVLLHSATYILSTVLVIVVGLIFVRVWTISAYYYALRQFDSSSPQSISIHRELHIGYYGCLIRSPSWPANPTPIGTTYFHGIREAQASSPC